ncbi:single-stranded DNA-binding protein [Dyadobacter crusticola]|uniref:single-stranded DNA-binding protein n=1 Tax=Dyadobacter crusticola TaxID=292407 RepID=UPI0004E0C640|nr:single-stranded DNA-binding protein [Dyadobacter crusticola]
MKQIQIIGNIGKDATLHSTNGREFVRCSVAASEKWKVGEETKEKTDWFSVFVNQKSLLSYLKKGTSVFVQGELSVTVRRDDSSGHYVADLKINADKVKLLSAANNGQQAGSAAMPAAPAAPGSPGDEGDDLPF